MNNSQNRLLLAAVVGATTTRAAANANANTSSFPSDADRSSASVQSQQDDEINQHSVDDDFDSYWEEEARNPHRNRIRIGRQYQATVPTLLKGGEKDTRKLEELETLSFCPKKSSKVSDAELSHYFTVAKSLNIFASLVETRSLLGRDVTIADLNHIRNKEGLSLASVIQPNRQSTNYINSGTSPSSSSTINNSHQQHLTQNTSSPNKSPQQSASSPKDQSNQLNERLSYNQPLMKALSHFISLHHPCHHNTDCKKLLKDMPLEDETISSVSITAGNLRQSSSMAVKDSKIGRSRSSVKQAHPIKDDQIVERESDDHQNTTEVQTSNFDDWTREEVELFSKAIEICGKNFGSIKKDFLPSKSVKSIVEYYYIGSRDPPDTKKKSFQHAETSDVCSSPEKSSSSNNGQGDGGDGGGSSTGTSGEASSHVAESSSSGTNSSNPSSRSSGSKKDSDNSDKYSADDMTQAQLKVVNQNFYPTVKSEHRTNCNSGDDRGNVETKNYDARMSVYNFDEENKDESPLRIDCPRPGSEVKPLRAKPILPGASIDSDVNNSNVGSLKFFMDGQLVLKLNACQDQQEGNDKCHWVQSGDKIVSTGKQKRYMKRGDKSSNSRQNGISSVNGDEDLKSIASIDEDSKESSLISPQPTQHSKVNSPQAKLKRGKIKTESSPSQVPVTSPVIYNRPPSSGQDIERNNSSNPMITQAMPWLQANSFAVAAALLGGLSFPGGNVMENNAQEDIPMQVSTKPMDLSMEHGPDKPQKSTSRSRSRQLPRNI